MIEFKASRRLKNGEKLDITVYQPPLPHTFKDLYWWETLAGRVVSGEMLNFNTDRFFVGEINGESAGSMLSSVSLRNREIGLVEFVKTAPGHRGKGVASLLLSELVRVFEENGGLALYLCTTNPHAYDLYMKQGFRGCIGDGMRYLTPRAGRFDDDYLSYRGDASVRKVCWGDLARFAPLYNDPRSKVFLKDHILKIFADVRFEKHFLYLMEHVENGQAEVLVLENPVNRLVGACHVRRGQSFYEQHVGLIDIHVCPSYFRKQGDALISAGIDAAGEKGFEILLAGLAGRDKEKLELFKKAGFETLTVIPGYYKDEAGATDRVLVCLRLKNNDALKRSRGCYKGHISDSIAEKIQSGKEFNALRA